MRPISNVLQFLNPSFLGVSGLSNSNAKEQILDKSIPDSFDKVDISPLSQFLLGQKMDVVSSTSSVSDSTIDFHLTFESKSMERLTADGYFSEKTKKLEMSFTYQFQQEVVKDGVKELHTFEVDFSLKIENMEKMSITPFEEKEDIMDFARKLIRKIIEIIGDEDKLLAGIILDKEDLEELSKIKDGELLKMIYQLIQMAILLAKMRQIMEGNEDQEVVFLHPIREKTSGVDINIDYSNMTEFHLEVRDITQEIASNREDIEALDLDSESKELESAQVGTS